MRGVAQSGAPGSRAIPSPNSMPTCPLAIPPQPLMQPGMCQRARFGYSPLDMLTGWFSGGLNVVAPWSILTNLSVPSARLSGPPGK